MKNIELDKVNFVVWEAFFNNIISKYVNILKIYPFCVIIVLCK